MGEKKKWYSLFVMTDASKEERDAPKEEDKRPTTVADMASALPPTEFHAPLKTESDGGVSFSAIYDAAGIAQPKHEFTILKISNMLQSEHLKNMTSEVKRGAIFVALEAANVKIDDVIQDAVQRDRALDAYEKVEERALRELEQQKAAENAAVQKEVDEFLKLKQAQMKANNGVVEQAKQRFSTWQLKKQAEEQRIYDAVAYFVSENPITTSAHPAAGRPAPDQPAHPPGGGPDKNNSD